MKPSVEFGLQTPLAGHIYSDDNPLAANTANALGEHIASAAAKSNPDMLEDLRQEAQVAILELGGLNAGLDKPNPFQRAFIRHRVQAFVRLNRRWHQSLDAPISPEGGTLHDLIDADARMTARPILGRTPKARGTKRGLKSPTNKDERKRAAARLSSECSICGRSLPSDTHVHCLLCRAKRSRLHRLANSNLSRRRYRSKYDRVLVAAGLTVPP